MALTKEIWINSIIEGLFADNTFASRSLNHSGFVSAKMVHVPNAGALPGVVKNRSELPGTVGGRNDIDLTYDIAEYTTNPLIIRDAEKVELVYDKRESLVGGTRTALAEAVHADLLRSWVPSGFAFFNATATTEKGHLAGTTSADLKAVTKADILALKKQFDKDDVPQTGRCILLDAVMYNQLLDSLSEAESGAFLTSVNAQKGTVGSLYGFDFYMRSTVLRTTAAGTSLAAAGSTTATDRAAGIAWQEGCVSRALGETSLFEENDSPTYYGDIISALVRAGGSYVRKDKKGVAVLYQGAGE